MKNWIIVPALVFVLAACGNKKEETSTATPATEEVNTQPAVAAMPAFALQDMNGNTIQLESLKGKKVFVNLWATWCPPCRREMPYIEKLYSTVDKNKVAFAMISLDEQFDLAKQYAATNNLQLPVYYPAGAMPAMFNVEGIPATFIFNEKGELIKRVDGSDDYDTDAYRQLLQ